MAWRDIPGLEGRYQASADGRIRLTREIAPIKQRTGYLTIAVFGPDGKRRVVPVHRLVALAWVDNPTNAPQVNHLDGVKANNFAFNLRWCTQSENMKHAWSLGLVKHTKAMSESFKRASKARAKASRKLSDKQLIEAKRRIANGELQKDIAKEFGVSRGVLGKRMRGQPYLT